MNNSELTLLLSDIAGMLPVAARLHPDDLQKLQVRVCNAIIALDPPPRKKLRVTEAFGPYNSRRYSQPWIALVTSWPVGGKPELTFGSYVGNSDGGQVEIMAEPGQIVRTGQKDHRGNNSESYWYVVEEDGRLKLIDQVQARELFNLNKESK